MAGTASIRRSKSGVSGPLKIAGRRFDRGLQVVRLQQGALPLGGAFERFEASIGIDDWVGKIGAVRFVATDARGAARLDLWRLVGRDFPTGGPQQRDALGTAGRHPGRGLGAGRLAGARGPLRASQPSGAAAGTQLRPRRSRCRTRGD